MISQDDTRQRLIQAAIELFGAGGYSGISTRAIADHAGVNVALIKYHFGSKDDLYSGAIDYLVGMVAPRLDMAIQMANSARSIAGDDPARQAKLVSQLINNVLSLFLDNPALQKAIPFVLRELLYPGPHFEALYDALPRRLHEMLTDLVSWILDLDPQSQAAKVRTHAVVGQIMIFHLGRAILQRRLGDSSSNYSEAVKTEIRHQVTRSVLSSLELPHVS